MSVSTVAESSVKLLDVRAVAEMLGCSTRHVERFRWFPFNEHKGWTVLLELEKRAEKVRSG